MGNKSEYLAVLNSLLETQKFEEIKHYLAAHSNLPGPRGNLELAEAFYCSCTGLTLTEELWHFLLELSENAAPTNDPQEILPFCAVEGLANLFFDVDDAGKSLVLKKLRMAMNDRRWRMREAAANGCQIIAEKDGNVISQWFLHIYPSTNLFEKRGMIAALAHPPILNNYQTARFSLESCERILDDVLALNPAQLKEESFVVLKKGLEYAPSVFVSKLPAEGFQMLKQYAQLDRKELNAIIQANLKKSRLQKYYKKEIEEVEAILNHS